MRSGRSLHASNSDCNFVQSGTYCRPFRKLDGDEPAIEKSERRRVGVRIQIVLLLNGLEPTTIGEISYKFQADVSSGNATMLSFGNRGCDSWISGKLSHDHFLNYAARGAVTN